MTSELYLILFVILGSVALLGDAQVPGFISLDCGLPEGESYSDTITNINYTSDASYISTGISAEVAPDYRYEKHLCTLRSFPDGKRNCYTLKPEQAKGNKFLIRARFFYGNYDNKSMVPEFEVYIGPNVWLTQINMRDEGAHVTKEIIHVPSTNNIQVCLVNTGSGTPLISSLELRPLKSTTYKTDSGSLVLVSRNDIGSNVKNRTTRYRDDTYDRRWEALNPPNWAIINTSLTFDQNNRDQPPSIVMQTAGRPINYREPLEFSFDSPLSTNQYYVYLYFAEIEKLQTNQTREFDIFANGSKFHGPLVPNYLTTNTIFRTISGETVTISIRGTERATLPPILNAYEVYSLANFSQSETNQTDADAILNIKTIYGLKRNWEGDPCAPIAYSWDGLSCSYHGNEEPKIIELNLSSSGLTGEIPSVIVNLTSIQHLDLSNNNLSGKVPDFLSQLLSLRVLNLKGNDLKGPVPDELLKRSQNGLLHLSVDNVMNACLSTSCAKKIKNIVTPLVGSLAALLAVVSAAAVLLWCKKRKQVARFGALSVKSNDAMEPSNRRLKYADILKITNNFERVLGKGGFGTVYHGLFGETQVAVKVLSPSSVQGYQQFQAEVKLLVRVHHRNLTNLIGYCIEGTHMLLVYEYMENGDLESHLSGKNANVLSWESRLRIAADTAQGLEYLHHGCKPPIIHRDIKTTNILLDKKFQANLADFGLSRVFPNETGSSHVSTTVAGTPGYLDPEYNLSNHLNEKSDVYSFGVVLLKLISSRHVIVRTHEKPHISQWVSFMLAEGDIRNIVDRRILDQMDINSAWKALEVAMSCVSSTPTRRPSMNEVVIEIKACLEMELSRTMGHGGNELEDPAGLVTMSSHSEFKPLAR